MLVLARKAIKTARYTNRKRTNEHTESCLITWVTKGT